MHAEEVSAVPCSSGTAALHLALLAFGIGEGNRVAVADITFGAAAFVVEHVGASLHLVDVFAHNGMAHVPITPDLRPVDVHAVILTALYGQEVSERDVSEWRQRFPWARVIIDAAECFGHLLNGADAVTYSFYANKHITTGEGGALIMASQRAAKHAQLYRDADKTRRTARL